MDHQRKSFPGVVAVKDAVQGIAEMYVSVFGNTDYGGEVVDPGFFTESLARKLPKGVWMHDWMQPVAKTLEAEEVLAGDGRLPERISALGGLRILGKFNMKTQRGREAFSDLEEGLVDEFSIGYLTEEDRHEGGVIHLVKGTLFEWSPVLVGMNPLTSLQSTKSDSPEVRLSYAEHRTWLLGQIAAFKERTDRRFDLREKEDRGLSGDDRSAIRTVAVELRGIADDYDRLFVSTEPEKARQERELAEGQAAVAAFARVLGIPVPA